MEPKPALPESAAHANKCKRFSKVQILGLVSAILLLAVIVILVFTSLSRSKVVWLTPAELVRSTQPGPFTTFKQNVKNLTGPVWRRFRRAPPQIAVSSSLLTLSSTTAEQIGLGRPTTTSGDGMGAWVLTPMESSALQQRLKTNSAASRLGSPSIMTFNGHQTRLVMGNTPAAAGALQVDTTIDLIPKVVSGSIKLTIAATSTESAVPLGSAPSVRTNFTAACQAVIPNGGSLVLDGGPPKDGSANRYLLIVSPRVWKPVDRQTK
jgi:hypothetical protein